MKTVRIIVALIFFAGGAAFSESLGSEIQYGAELKTKQETLGSIREDTAAIEMAFTRVIAAENLTAIVTKGINKRDGSD